MCQNGWVYRECVHLVTCHHFRSRDKDGGHTSRSLSFTWQRWRSHQSICHSRKRNPMLHANLMTLCFIEAELWPIEFLYCGNRDFRLFLLLWPWPWPDFLHIRTWPVFPGDTPDVQYQLPTSRLSKVIVWQTAKQTDTTEIIYLAASQVVNNLLEL